MATKENARAFLEARPDFCGDCLGPEGVEGAVKLLMRYFSDEELPLFAQWLAAPDHDKPDFGPDFDIRRQAYADDFVVLITPGLRQLLAEIERLDKFREERRRKKSTLNRPALLSRPPF